MYKSLPLVIFCFFLGCKNKSAEQYLNEAARLSEQKKYGEAILKLDKAIEINPRYIGAYINRGADKASLGETEAAIMDYQKVLTIDPGNILALGNIANNYHKMENYEKAIHYLYRAIRIKEKSPLTVDLMEQQTSSKDFDIPYNEICFRLGLVYYDADSLSKANQYFDDALKSGYMPDKCYYWIGWVNLSSGKTNSACSFFTKAIIYGNIEADSVRQLYCQ